MIHDISHHSSGSSLEIQLAFSHDHLLDRGRREECDGQESERDWAWEPWEQMWSSEVLPPFQPLSFLPIVWLHISQPFGVRPGHVTCFGQWNGSGRVMSVFGANMCSSHCWGDCGCTRQEEASLTQPECPSECDKQSPVPACARRMSMSKREIWVKPLRFGSC